MNQHLEKSMRGPAQHVHRGPVSLAANMVRADVAAVTSLDKIQKLPRLCLQNSLVIKARAPW
jgi:hypothetical protein